VIDQYRTSLAQQEDSPEAYFNNEAVRIMYGGSPWSMPMTLADLDGISIEAAERYIRRCTNPADYTFVFTGNIDTETIVPLLETWLASIPAGEGINRYRDTGIIRPGASEHILYRGKEDRSHVLLCWFTKETWSPELDAAADVLTEYLDIILTEEIREKLGGVYSINAGAGVSTLPPPGESVLQSYFSCGPGRAEELGSAVIREIEKIAAGNIDGGIFGKSADALCTAWEESMQNNRYIAQSYANFLVRLDQSPGSLNRLPARYRAVRPQDIQNLAGRLLSGGPVRIIMYPETAR
jgi:zinc protease